MFCLGIGLLVKGSGWLVDAAARIAKQFGVSAFVIGITIVAVGTSLPELAAIVTASFYGNGELAIGNIIGSNMADIALLAGLAGLFVPISLKRDIYNRDGAIMLGATILFYLFSLNGILGPAEGGIFLFLFFAYILYFVVSKKPYEKQLHFTKYLWNYGDPEKNQLFENTPRIADDLHRALANDLKRFSSGSKAFFKYSGIALRKNRQALRYFAKQLVFLAAGAACIFFGSNLVVSSAVQFPISQLFVGLFFVSIGTILPELSVTITSLRKGLPEIMVGNLIGSTIANILLIGGLAAIVRPIAVPVAAIKLGFVFLILSGWLFLVFLRNDHKITAIEAITLLLIYTAFVAANAGMSLGV